MKIRELQREKRRQAIISKGLELFISKGYKATTIADVAKSVGMSNGLFFHYYPNTEKLYEELACIGLKATQRITDNMDMPALVYFENLSKFLLEEINHGSFTAQMFVLMSMAARSEDTPQTVRKIVSEVNTSMVLSQLIEKGQEQATIKNGNAIALANTFLCCLYGIAEQKVTNKDMLLPEPSWIVDILRK